MSELPEHVRRNRAYWDVRAAEYEGPGLRNWSSDEPTWGIWGVPECELGVLPGNARRRATRSSSAAAPPTSRPGSRAAAPDPVGIDNSEAQLGDRAPPAGASSGSSSR